MIERLWKQFREQGKTRLKTSDLYVFEILLEKGKTRQYPLEKALEKSGHGLQHSTVTSKLAKLVSRGCVNRYIESDGFKYYELTPIGLSVLLQRGKITIERAMTYFQDRPKLYYEMLARMQPNLKDRLQKIPPFFVDQVTDDLWIFYYIKNRLDLRRETLEFLLRMRTEEEYESGATSQAIQLLCVNRIEVEGKGVCFKQRQRCPYQPVEILGCPIIKKQVMKELDRLKKK